MSRYNLMVIYVAIVCWYADMLICFVSLHTENWEEFSFDLWKQTLLSMTVYLYSLWTRHSKEAEFNNIFYSWNISRFTVTFIIITWKKFSTLSYVNDPLHHVCFFMPRSIAQCSSSIIFIWMRNGNFRFFTPLKKF